jgi:Tol biopolymer transport system component
VQSADGAEVRTIAGELRVRGAADWSPDGRTIVTGGRDAHGPGLFLVPTDGAPPVRLVNGQAFDPVWSPDGSLIVYAGPLASGTAPVRAVRRDGTAVALPPIQTSGQGGGCLRFLPDGTGVVYMLGPTGAQGFWLLDLRDMTTRQLAQLSSTATTNTFDISPHGTRIVFDRVRENSDVILIELRD